MTRLTEFPDPVEQHDKVLAQIATWRERNRKRPSHLIEVQIAALLRLVDRLDDMIEARRLERQDAADWDDYSPPPGGGGRIGFRTRCRGEPAH